MPKRRSIPYNALNDILFKAIFAQENNSGKLLNLVNAILRDDHQTPIESLSIRNPFNIRRYRNDKENILDVRAVDTLGRIIQLEVQLLPHAAFVERSLYYWARYYANQLKRSEDYQELHATIGINIVGFPLDEDGLLHNVYRIYKEQNKQRVLTEHLQFHFIDVSSLKNRNQGIIMKNELASWMYFLTNLGLKEEDPFMETLKDQYPELGAVQSSFDEAIDDEETWDILFSREEGQRLKNTLIRSAREAQEALEKGMAQIEETKARVLQEGHQIGHQIGHQEGRQEGRQELALDVAQKLIERGLSAQEIAEITELPMDRVLGMCD